METINILQPSVNVDEPAFLADVDGLKGVLSLISVEGLEQVRNEATEAKRSVDEYDREFRRRIAYADAKQRSLVALQKQIEESRENIAPVQNHLRGLVVGGKYQSFLFEGETIVGLTSSIVIRSSGYRYQLGSFKAVADVRRRQVKFYAGEGCREGDYIHPHISGHAACWGNVQAEVPRIIGQGNFGLLFELVYDFLRSYNGTSPYRKLAEWPKLVGRQPGEVDPVSLTAPLASEELAAQPAQVADLPIELQGEVLPVPQGRFAQMAASLPVPRAARTPRTPRRTRREVTISPVSATWINTSSPDTNSVTFNGNSNVTNIQIEYEGNPAAQRRVVLSERVDSALRRNGINVEQLTVRQRRTLRRLVRDQNTLAFPRLLRYYTNWLNRQ